MAREREGELIKIASALTHRFSSPCQACRPVVRRVPPRLLRSGQNSGPAVSLPSVCYVVLHHRARYCNSAVLEISDYVVDSSSTIAPDRQGYAQLCVGLARHSPVRRSHDDYTSVFITRYTSKRPDHEYLRMEGSLLACRYRRSSAPGRVHGRDKLPLLLQDFQTAHRAMVTSSLFAAAHHVVDRRSCFPRTRYSFDFVAVQCEPDENSSYSCAHHGISNLPMVERESEDIF